jgi:hypothetical protein
MTQQLKTVKHFKLDNTAFDTSANENDACRLLLEAFITSGIIRSRGITKLYLGRLSNSPICAVLTEFTVSYQLG